MNLDRKRMIKKEIARIMKYCGSDAGERKEPGSKLNSQIDCIIEFLDELEEFDELVANSNFYMLQITATGM